MQWDFPYFLSVNPRKPISCLLVAVALLATIITPSLSGENPPAAKHDGPPGKPYVYKTSAGKERSMEIYFPPKSIDYLVAPNEGHGFFNQPAWHTVTLIAADDFLVKHGLLSGKATLTPPDTDKPASCSLTINA